MLYRYALSIGLLLFPLIAVGQTCTFPVIDNSWRFGQRQEFDFTGKIKQSFTELTLEPLREGPFDTLALKHTTYLSGRLVQFEDYKYADYHERIKIGLLYPKSQSMVLYGVSSVFRYDSSGHQDQLDTYVYPSGSSALVEQVAQKWAMERNTAGYKAGYNKDSIMQERARFVDSLQLYPPLSLLKAKDSIHSVYNAQGNPVYKFHLKEQNQITEYAYKSEATDLKQIQYIRKHGSIDNHAEEHQVTYRSPCQISSILSYSAPLSEEGQLQKEIWLNRVENRFYNRSKLSSTIATLVFPVQQQTLRHIARYRDDGQERDLLVLDSNRTTHSRDTINYAKFSYDNRGRLLEVFQEQHSKYGTARYREALRYDALGNLIEIRTYVMGQKHNEPARLLRQRLLFYGTQSDKQTAALSLAGKPLSPKWTDTTRPKPRVYKFAEVMPRFNGNIQTWVNARLQYPADARADGIGGRVTAGFIVGANGEVRDVKIIRSLHPSCDQEVLRVIRMMPPWIPGRMNGYPVDVYTTYPVMFAQ